MIAKSLLSVVSVIWLTSVMSCRSDRLAHESDTSKNMSKADSIIAEVYAAHGAHVLANALFEFDFRGDRYVARRKSGIFSYERIYSDSAGTVRDVVNNDGIFREMNGVRVPIDERTTRSIHTRVNSIVYFASLPYALLDPAVIPRYLGQGKIDGVNYDRVEVTFQEEGGGRDFQDRFLYWVNQNTGRIDYFAYYYLTDETGSRFREIVNPRDVGGFLAVDHINYAASPDTLGERIELFEALMDAAALDTVSRIPIENVSVVAL